MMVFEFNRLAPRLGEHNHEIEMEIEGLKNNKNAIFIEKSNEK